MVESDCGEFPSLTSAACEGEGEGIRRVLASSRDLLLGNIRGSTMVSEEGG